MTANCTKGSIIPHHDCYNSLWMTSKHMNACMYSHLKYCQKCAWRQKKKVVKINFPRSLQLKNLKEMFADFCCFPAMVLQATWKNLSFFFLFLCHFRIKKLRYDLMLKKSISNLYLTAREEITRENTKIKGI